MAHLEGSDFVWVTNPHEAWVCARLKARGADFIEIETAGGTQRLRGKEIDEVEPCGLLLNHDLDNLVELDVLSEGNILHHVRKRYNNDSIYTFVGNILVAVNPFRMLNIYNNQAIDFYRDNISAGTTIPPHVYAIASLAYDQLTKTQNSQSILISGESGSGKTETTKKVLQFLATVAGGASSSSSSSAVAANPKSLMRLATSAITAANLADATVEQKILQTNPVLESFGNAKTLRNNNSSRFGKWMEIDFDSRYKISGCHMLNYLLEKSRVVVQSDRERNYHIYYMLLAGASDAQRREYYLEGPEFYHYLNQSNCYFVDGVDDASDFRVVDQAMTTLSFSKVERSMLYRIVSTILHIGNLQFETDSGDDTSRVDSNSFETLEALADLLGVDKAELARSLTEKLVQAGKGSFVNMDLRPDQARDTRDVLAKNMYSKTFDWLISRVNDTLALKSPAAAAASTSEESKMQMSRIGVLDIFGFEVFENNSFEQLCINYANEKLQFHFNEVIFASELKLYEEEGINYEVINFQDNQECLDLIEARPIGILSLLEEECSLKGNVTDASFVVKLNSNFGEASKTSNRHFFRRKNDNPEIFAVYHFAGPVQYNAAGFLDKNRDIVSDTLAQMVVNSNITIISEAFNEELARNRTQDTGAKGKRGSAAQPKKSGQKKTLGGQFASQLQSLISILRKTEPHFIRCIKPNQSKSANLFEGMLCLKQMRYAGLFEAIRIRKSGYAYRVPHGVFARRYSMLVTGLLLRIEKRTIGPRAAAEKILSEVTASSGGEFTAIGWAQGKSKVFLKGLKERAYLERSRNQKSVNYVILLQTVVRAFVARCKFYRLRMSFLHQDQLKEDMMKTEYIAVVKLQKMCRGYLARKLSRYFADLIVLRKAVAAKDSDSIQAILEKLNEVVLLQTLSSKSKSGKNSVELQVSSFRKEIARAEKVCKLLGAQQRLTEDIQLAVTAEEPQKLSNLLARADRMGMTGQPVLEEAKQAMQRLNDKCDVLNSLVEFLKDETKNGEQIPDLLKQAASLEIQASFLKDVKSVYDYAAPKLHSRARLRLAVENVHMSELEEALVEARELCVHFGAYCTAEIHAAEAMLQMLKFERQLWFGGNARHQEQGIRLNHEMLKLCDAISSAGYDDRKRLEKRMARVCRSSERKELIVRSYKWRKVYATWSFPEFLTKEQANAKSAASTAVADNDGDKPTKPVDGKGEFGDDDDDDMNSNRSDDDDDDNGIGSGHKKKKKNENDSDEGESPALTILSDEDYDEFVKDSDDSDDFFGFKPSLARNTLAVIVRLHSQMQGAKPPAEVQRALIAQRYAIQQEERKRHTRLSSAEKLKTGNNMYRELMTKLQSEEDKRKKEEEEIINAEQDALKADMVIDEEDVDDDIENLLKENDDEDIAGDDDDDGDATSVSANIAGQGFAKQTEASKRMAAKEDAAMQDDTVEARARVRGASATQAVGVTLTTLRRIAQRGGSAAAIAAASGVRPVGSLNITTAKDRKRLQEKSAAPPNKPNLMSDEVVNRPPKAPPKPLSFANASQRALYKKMYERYVETLTRWETEQTLQSTLAESRATAEAQAASVKASTDKMKFNRNVRWK